jgi:ABC-type Co2+ transport system permease subunit
VVLIMSCEGAVLGGVAALIYRNSRRSLWPALLAAVVSGRAAAFVAAWALARSFGLPPGFASLAMLAQGLPGVALQIAVVPVVLGFLARRQGPLFAGDR